MSKIFVSYNRQDEQFVRDLHARLEAIGLDTWTDWKDIPAGYSWREALFEGLAACDTILLCLSTKYAASEMCRMEVFVARSYGKRLIPVVLDNCYNEFVALNDLRSLVEIQAVPFASKKLVGLPLTDDELYQMVIDAIKGVYKPLPTGDNLFYFAYPISAAVFATKIADDLNATGIPTWIGTRNHNVGYDWQKEQWDAMMKARAFVIVLNENAPLSDHIRRQVLFARTRHLPIIPIIAPDTDFAAMHKQMDEYWEMRLVSEIQWLKPEPSFEEMMLELKEIADKMPAKAKSAIK